MLITLTSLDNESQAKEFINVATCIMEERKFDLIGWEVTGESNELCSNVLGLLWNKESDTLEINIERLLSMKIEIVTKKIILSAAHRLFDPIGMTSSIALIPKLLVQETWQSNLSWNEEVRSPSA